MKRLHVHVGVNDLDQSVSFYSTLFGAQPTVNITLKSATELSGFTVTLKQAQHLGTYTGSVVTATGAALSKPSGALTLWTFWAGYGLRSREKASSTRWYGTWWAPSWRWARES